MKAVVKTKRGAGNIEVMEVEEPKIGDKDLLIEVKACGICGSDPLLWRDLLTNYNPPIIMGHEFSGVITEVGREVTGFEVGDRVCAETTRLTCGRCYYCRTEGYPLCKDRKGVGFQVNGAYTKYVVHNPMFTHRLPENVTFEEAALMDPLSVTHHAVMDRAKIKPYDFVVITGPGPIGLLSLQLVKLFNPRHIVVVGTSRGEKWGRLKLAKELGADTTLVVQREDVVKGVLEMTNGVGADVAIEASGSHHALNQAINFVRPDGQIVLIGMYEQAPTINLTASVQHQLAFTTSWSSLWRGWEAALQLLSKKKVLTKPLISHKFPITEWEKAFKLMEESKGIKILLTPVD